VPVRVQAVCSTCKDAFEGLETMDALRMSYVDQQHTMTKLWSDGRNDAFLMATWAKGRPHAVSKAASAAPSRTITR